MQIGIIGINHKSADLRLREKLAKEAERLFGPTHSAHSHFSYVLLSTCNRTEIYFHSENLTETHTYLLNTMRERIDEEFEHRIYSYFGIDCFLHLAKVTAGIDSALIGETEIQGQVKRAYEMAHAYRPLSAELHFLFQKCLKIGKNVRSEAQFLDFPSLEEVILNVGQKLLGHLRARKILFVGLSEINYKIFTRFKKLGCAELFLCNRSFDKACKLAEKEEARLLSWEKLNTWSNFDLAIFGTKCPHFLVKREQLQFNSSCKLIFDLSVPRNVDPKIGRHLTLLNIDQLNRAVDRKRREKALRIARLETQVIAQAVERQNALFRLKEIRSQTLLSSAV
jgi:glutamyl-tRNA reductase